VTADANEPDTSFGDEAAREPLGGAEQLGDLSDGQMSLYGDLRLPAIKAAPLRGAAGRR
jgi:hypothetical protein